MKRAMFILFVVVSFVSLGVGGYALGPRSAMAAAPSKIVFGQAIALSGPTAMVTGVLERAAIKLWLQEVNAKGGIYVKEYGKRIPVELIQYDNKGDIETMLKLVNKLITADKVDFLFPPWGSDMHFAMIPVANKAKHPMVTWTISSEKVAAMAPKLPYIFFLSPRPSIYMGHLKDLLIELGVDSAAIIYNQGLWGIETGSALKSQLEGTGIEVLLYKSYPGSAKDLSPLLKQVKSANPDVVAAMTYPPDSLLITEQSMLIALNPKVFVVEIGGGMPMFRNKFGAAKIEGLFAIGGWDVDATSKTKEYFEKFKKVNGFEPDYFSAPWGYAAYEIFEQAIEKAGTLNKDKVRDVLATETFTGTSAGPVEFKFVNQLNDELPSFWGQWQNGVLNPIAPKKTRKAQPIYPKPPWP